MERVNIIVEKNRIKMEDGRIEQVVGGNGVYEGNPLTGMLDMYYQIAMEETEPAAKAEAAETYNRTLDKLMSEGVNCAGYRHIRV